MHALATEKANVVTNPLALSCDGIDSQNCPSQGLRSDLGIESMADCRRAAIPLFSHACMLPLLFLLRSACPEEHPPTSHPPASVSDRPSDQDDAPVESACAEKHPYSPRV